MGIHPSPLPIPCPYLWESPYPRQPWNFAYSTSVWNQNFGLEAEDRSIIGLRFGLEALASFNVTDTNLGCGCMKVIQVIQWHELFSQWAFLDSCCTGWLWCVYLGWVISQRSYRGKSGPALGGTEYRLMPSACRLIAGQPLWNLQFRYLVSRAPMRRRSIVVV